MTKQTNKTTTTQILPETVYNNLIKNLLSSVDTAKFKIETDYKLQEIYNSNNLFIPFDKFNLLKDYLLQNSMISQNDVFNLVQNFREKNQYWNICQLSGKKFGTKIEDIILNQNKNIKKPVGGKPNKKKLHSNLYYDENYKNEYDLILIPNENNLLNNIKIEVKATSGRLNDKKDDSLYEKLLDSKYADLAVGTFQQLKPHLCDVFIFVVCFTDEIFYYVLKSDEFLNNNLKMGKQHRGNEKEGQISYKKQIFDKYKVENVLEIEKRILELFNQ